MDKYTIEGILPGHTERVSCVVETNEIQEAIYLGDEALKIKYNVPSVWIVKAEIE